MMKMKENRNWRTLWRLCSLPEILPAIFDDRFAGPGRVKRMRRKVRAIIARRENHFYQIFHCGQFAGGFVLYRTGAGVFEVHTLLKKDFHGRIAVALGRFAIGFVMALPFVEKLTSYCPDNLPHTFIFARMCGFRHVGEYPMKWIKDGITYGMKAVEFTKGDLPCHS